MKNKCGRTFRKRKKNKLSLSHIETCGDYYLLLKWMGKSGHKPTKKLRPKYFAGSGRGLMAEEAIHPGDIVVSIPEKLLITPHLVLCSELGDVFKKYCPTAAGHQILSVFLMCEKLKNETSEWYPYINTLPQTFSIPVYFDEQYLCMLPNSLRIQAMNQCEFIKASYHQLKTLLDKLGMVYSIFKNILNFELYKWAWCNVNTRCIYLNKNDQDCFKKSQSSQIALAPYLDLLNHSVYVEVSTSFNKDEKKFEIKSLCKYKKYSQVFINYGCHENRKLFIEYGFVVPGNYNDSVPFSTDDIVAAYKECKFPVHILPEKLKFMQENNLLRNAACSCDGLSWNLIITLRILTRSCSMKEWKSILYENNKVCEDGDKKYEDLKRKLLSLKLEEYNFMETRCTDSPHERSYTQQLIYDLLLTERKLLLNAFQ